MLTASTASLGEPKTGPQRNLSEAGYSHHSPAQTGVAELLEKGSRFIGVCAPVSGEQDAKSLIASVREKHPGASHNVYAYKLKDGACRLSDDGEPSGTAGSPVFEVLVRRGVVNAAIVVTRYFGGTLLGAGGLIRAYAKTAAAALDAAGVAEWKPWREAAVTVPYTLYEQTARLLEGHQARGIEPVFGTDVTIHFLVLETRWGAVAEALSELSAGCAELKTLGIRYSP